MFWLVAVSFDFLGNISCSKVLPNCFKKFSSCFLLFTVLLEFFRLFHSVSMCFTCVCLYIVFGCFHLFWLASSCHKFFLEKQPKELAQVVANSVRLVKLYKALRLFMLFTLC